MKTNLWKTGCVAGMIFALGMMGVSISRGEEPVETIRSDAEKAFSELTVNSIDGLKAALAGSNAKGGDGAGAKFQIADVKTPATSSSDSTEEKKDANTGTTATSTSKLGIKVWFELSDGTLVNPTKRKWNPKEKFYIHVQSAVPVYVALYQNYPDSRPTSREVYPSDKYADSFKAIQPGQSTKLPVVFEMDDDMRDEIMSMVIVRADWSGIQNGLTAQATASVTNNNGTAQVTAQVNTVGVGTMKCINDRVVTKKELSKEDAKTIVSDLTDQNAEALSKAVNEEASNAKFQIIGAAAPSSTQANDVCFYMFGAGNIGQWQLTIKK